MQKKGKFVFGVLSLAAFAGGAYYFVKNILNKDSEDDFDDFEDDFDDFEVNDDNADKREYVTLNITEPSADAESPETADTEEEIDTVEESEFVEESALADDTAEELADDEEETTEE